MPSINIREIDNTTTGVVEFDEHVVLVPGRKSASSTISKDTLFEDAEDFTSKIIVNEADADETMEYARLLLKNGLKVYYVLVDSTISASDLADKYAAFKDRGKYDLRFITRGALGFSAEADRIKVDVAMIKAAAERGDAIALIDPIINSTSSTKAEDIREYLSKLLDNNSPITVKRGPEDDEVIEDGYKYAAAFAPNWKTSETILPATIADSFFCPGSLAYLLCFGKHIKKNPDWFAMAGSERGVLPVSNVETATDFGDADASILLKRSLTSAEKAVSTTNIKPCNMICEIRPYGNIVWGNRTLFALTPSYPDLIASSFLNIRNLCCDIKKLLYKTSRRFTYEPNTDVLWANFTGAITPLLDKMKSNQGIEGYELERVVSKKKGVLKAKVKIVPIEAVEDFTLTVFLEDSLEVAE